MSLSSINYVSFDRNEVIISIYIAWRKTNTRKTNTRKTNNEINEKKPFLLPCTYHCISIDPYLPGRSSLYSSYICVCVEREMVKREETINNNNNRELQVAEQYYIYTDVRGACNYTYIYSSLYILPRNHEFITTKVKQTIH